MWANTHIMNLMIVSFSFWDDMRENMIIIDNNLSEQIIIRLFTSACTVMKGSHECSGVATGGNGGVRTPPLLFRPLLGLAQIRWKVFFTYRGGTPCMYIVTFTAHQQRNMVRTPPLFWGWRRHCMNVSSIQNVCSFEKSLNSVYCVRCGLHACISMTLCKPISGLRRVHEPAQNLRTESFL